MKTFDNIIGNNSHWLLAAVCTSLFFRQGVTSVSVLTVAGLAFIYGRNLRLDTRREVVLLALPSVLFLAYGVWVTMSDDLQGGFAELTRKYPLVLIPAAVLCLKKTIHKANLSMIMKVFVVVCVLSSFYCLGHAVANMLEHGSLSLRNEDRTYYFFSYALLTAPVNLTPIYLSLFFNMAFIFVLFDDMGLRDRARFGLALYISVFILMIASKIGIIALVATLACWIMARYRKLAVIYVSVFIVALVVAIGNFSFLKERFVTTAEFDFSEPYGHAWTSNALRLAIWSCAFEAIEREPVLGYGTADGVEALRGVYKEKNFIWGMRESYNPHNEFLATWLDLGIPGVLILCIVLFLPAANYLRTGNLIGLCFIVMIILFFMIENVLYRQKGIVFFSVFYSLVSLNSNSSDRVRESTRITH